MADDRNPDLDIAIGENAFHAGWEACLVYYGATVVEPDNTLARYSAWDNYTPPEELCGGGTTDG